MAATASRLTTLARRLTAERGLSGFTIEEVCEEVGISRRTFFNYFPSKEEAVIGIADADETRRYAEEFYARGSRGWPAVVDDLIDLAIDRARAAGIGVAEHAVFLTAISREPRLLARFVDINREHERQLTELVAARESASPDDPRARAAVRVVSTALHAAVERILDPRDAGDFAAAVTDSLAAVRAVTAIPTEPPTEPAPTEKDTP